MPLFRRTLVLTASVSLLIAIPALADEVTIDLGTPAVEGSAKFTGSASVTTKSASISVNPITSGGGSTFPTTAGYTATPGQFTFYSDPTAIAPVPGSYASMAADIGYSASITNSTSSPESETFTVSVDYAITVTGSDPQDLAHILLQSQLVGFPPDSFSDDSTSNATGTVSQSIQVSVPAMTTYTLDLTADATATAAESIPEPASFFLLGGGLGALALVGVKKAQQFLNP